MSDGSPPLFAIASIHRAGSMVAVCTHPSVSSPFSIGLISLAE